ncbi:MAG: ABC transporter ATP-binding protein, partial [Anaerolineales bacterium]
MPERQPAIAVDNVTKRFGSFTAVNGVSFEVGRGEIFGFLGPNGSGKTTTIRMMLGLMAPSGGSVHVLGMKVDGDARRIRPRVGYMSQRFSLYNDLTVLQNLKFYGAAYGLSDHVLQERIAEALALTLDHMMEDTDEILSRSEDIRSRLRALFEYLIDGILRFPNLIRAHLSGPLMEGERESPF